MNLIFNLYRYNIDDWPRSKQISSQATFSECTIHFLQFNNGQFSLVWPSYIGHTIKQAWKNTSVHIGYVLIMVTIMFVL